MIKSESNKLNHGNDANKRNDANCRNNDSLSGGSGGSGVGGGGKISRSRKKWSGKGGGIFSRFLLIAYILLKYPIKFGLLFSVASIMYFILKQIYAFGCQAVTHFITFFTAILNPGDFDLIVFTIPNIFNIFMGFLDLFIGVIYLGITFLLFILLGLITIPFNLIFAF